MPVEASQIFDFLERHETGVIHRHEFASTDFGVLRRSLRKIAHMLRESDDPETLNVSENLQSLLSNWLTTPIHFDQNLFKSVEDVLGQPESVRIRWGDDVKDLYGLARNAAFTLSKEENSLRLMLGEVIDALVNDGSLFKIYCHRRARSFFETLLPSSEEGLLLQDIFLHSVRDYREAPPFDTLLKVGPLRARGWGSVPDALLTAPRFNKLVLFVWSGCKDESGFGYDPTSTDNQESREHQNALGSSTISNYGPAGWIEQSSSLGEDLNILLEGNQEIDELQMFSQSGQQEEKRAATLIQVDEEHGILFPPHSRILSFDPVEGNVEPVSLRSPESTLVEGMFIALPVVNEVDLGGVQADPGHFNSLWRKKLEELWRADEEKLIKHLHDAGLELIRLDLAIKNWIRPPGTVLHAPQKLRHFKILLRVLDIRDDEHSSSANQAPFWQLAWNEIRRSRGEAIQAGVQEHEIIDEELLAILTQLVPEIRSKAHQKDGFILLIPDRYGVKGLFLFFRVCGLEDGFRAAGADLKAVRELSAIDQWRD